MADQTTALPNLLLHEAIQLAEKKLAAESISLSHRSLVNAVACGENKSGWLLTWMTAEQIEQYRSASQRRGGGALRVEVHADKTVEFTIDR